MKRQPLKRRTPMNRTRSHLRRNTPKRRRENARDAAKLDVFALEHSLCWLCRQPDAFWNRLEIHHLAGRTGPRRNDRANLFRCCSACHESRFTNVHSDGMQPLDRLCVGLAYKQVWDAEHYDRSLVLSIAGFAPSAVTELEVEQVAVLVRKENVLP